MKNFILAVSILSTLNSFAQQAVTNKGNIQIHSGAGFSAFGTFTNQSGANLVNNGNLYLKSNVVNDQSTMTVGSGTLNLNGSTTQTLSGSQVLKTSHLTTANNAGIQLNNDLAVSGTHTFSSGMISTSTTNFLIYESGSSYLGSTNGRHVNGWVKKRGSTDFIFPLGNGTVQRVITIDHLSASSEFNARYYNTTPNTNQKDGLVMVVDGAEYWAVNRVSGGTASLTMNWDHSKIAFPNWHLHGIVASNYNGFHWTDQGGTASGSVTSTGTLTSNIQSSFNLYTFASRTWPVPVTLLNFTARRRDGITLLDWKTAQEREMDRFDLERSDDGRVFRKIGQQAARNTGLTDNYQHPDNKPINRIAYYRLAMVDRSGKEQLSQVVAVTENSASKLTLLNNPVQDVIRLLASGEVNGSFDYSIHSINGQGVQKGKLVLRSNDIATVQLDKMYAKGTYILMLTGSDKFSFRFEVQ